MNALIFGFFLLTLPVFANGTLSIVTHPPETTLSWSSPGDFMRSLMKARFFLEKAPFGWALGKINCGNLERHIAAEPESFDVVAPVAFQGKGLGWFFATHSGEMTSEEAAKALYDSVSTDPASFSTSISLSTPQCERMVKFLDEFRMHKIARSWGLPHRPLMGEGATSASLLGATLEIGGVLSLPVLETWKRNLSLPRKLSGPPLTDEYVSVFSLFGSSWGKHGEDSVELSFWDPGLILDWVKKTGKTLDRSQAPVPEGNFWKQSLEYGTKKD